MTLWRCAPHALAASLEDGVVLLNMETGRYFSLNETGAFIWGLLESAASIEQLVSRIIEAYEVTPEDAERQVRELLAELATERLIAGDGE